MYIIYQCYKITLIYIWALNSLKNSWQLSSDRSRRIQLYRCSCCLWLSVQLLKPQAVSVWFGILISVYLLFPWHRQYNMKKISTVQINASATLDRVYTTVKFRTFLLLVPCLGLLLTGAITCGEEAIVRLCIMKISNYLPTQIPYMKFT